MKLGFVSAILPDDSLEDVLTFAADAGYDCVEAMCWPASGGESRRYAGVTHVDVDRILCGDGEAERVAELIDETGVSLSALGYYPNPLAADEGDAAAAVAHLRKVIEAAPRLGLDTVNTFVGRDPALSLDGNWPRFLSTWRPIIEHAEAHGVRVGIENCPMLFGEDEWPGGKNLAATPAVWRRMFEEIPSDHFGLNYDPSHLAWMQMDPITPVWEFAGRIVHAHAKDVRVDRHRFNDHGPLAHPSAYHTPKLPGQGDVDWGRFLGVLADAGYDGPVCVEVEDRVYERTPATRRQALLQSAVYLRNFIPPALEED